MSLRDTILAADDLARERVEVPEWDAVVWITELSAHDQGRLGRYFLDAQKGGGSIDDYNVQLLVLALVDEAGHQVFDQPDDVAALGKKNPAVIKRLYDQAERLNKLDEDSVDAEKKS